MKSRSPAIQEIGGDDLIYGVPHYGRFESPLRRPPASDSGKESERESSWTKQESVKEKQILDWID